jgi:TPR repeat protein
MKKLLLVVGVVSFLCAGNHGESNDPGMKLLQKGEFSKALKTFENECKNGNGWACGNAAIMYYRGMGGIKPNPDKAKKYYNRGCELNDIDSCENLGEIAYKEQNMISAKGYFQKVCGMKKYAKNKLDIKTIEKSCKRAEKIK